MDALQAKFDAFMNFFEFSTCLNPSTSDLWVRLFSDWYYYRESLNATHGSILARKSTSPNKCRATDSSEF